MLLLPAAVGIFLAALIRLSVPPAVSFHTPLPPDDSYRPRAAARCDAPQLHEKSFPLAHTCLFPIRATSTSVTVRITPPQRSASSTLALFVLLRTDPQVPVFESAVTGNAAETVTSLTPDTDYIFQLRDSSFRHVCRISTSTPATDANYIRNPSFESTAESPFLSTRFHPTSDQSPRHWTPFYNGGAARHCGAALVAKRVYYAPRSGSCMLRLGPLTSAPVFQEQRTQFYGAHQAVFPENARELVVSAWYATTPEVGQFRVRGASAQSERDALSMVVMYTLEDHMKGEQETKSVLLALNESRSDDSGKWISVCLHVGPDAAGRNISSVHVFFHFHDHNSGNVLIDDVSVFHVGEEDTEMISTCYRTATRNNLAGPHVGWVGKIIEYGGESDCIHLRAMVRPKQKQLTLAVPMTVDRVVRLEAMSRLYGGGPIVAAVVVSDESEARVFSQIWKAKMWLREHVDVQFVKRGADGGALAINVLRNIAVRMGETDFIVMLDVDMTPASRAFDCMRDENGTYLEQMLPIGEKRILTLPVFVGDVHQRSAADKEEVLNAVGRRAATTYCVNSQKANKMKRWYRMSGAGETRFMTDYEPYGIVRRDMHPSYDERFHGYGFNKISWGAGAEAGGWRMFVASDRMVTHLNHVENGWVSDMGAGQYLETWRAFFAFAAETESGRGRMREVARRARDGMRQCDACGASRGTRW